MCHSKSSERRYHRPPTSNRANSFKSSTQDILSPSVPRKIEQIPALVELHEAGAHRIEVNVIGQRRVVLPLEALHRNGPVPVAEELTPLSMPGVEAPGVRVLEQLQAGHEIGFGRFKEQMVRIAQQDPGVNGPAPGDGSTCPGPKGRTAGRHPRGRSPCGDSRAPSHDERRQRTPTECFLA